MTLSSTAQPALRVRIRFNTQWESSAGGAYKWRMVFPDGSERLAKSISITVPSWTSEDLLPNGVTKWHVTCEGVVVEKDGHVVIRSKAEPPSTSS